ncbi:uncharacterized protein BT62DRAFT_197136 [Guyanagaster necrorhizus]|uniref:Uncharacterized protein n=1 Tax=Guyanagaster necrorhizus TaxID=856835 RepID=A0A9P7VQL3_9AGAR|nr:uncharacterized protein BT62DRAFT_197136 [Guyanagaster necrorhizus MCA 3950]KAG7444895.1 hypothetical protein BT62DRAFT_197136 [Guyanagaster necrorhizus MCA 3950]
MSIKPVRTSYSTMSKPIATSPFSPVNYNMPTEANTTPVPLLPPGLPLQRRTRPRSGSFIGVSPFAPHGPRGYQCPADPNTPPPPPSAQGDPTGQFGDRTKQRGLLAPLPSCDSDMKHPDLEADSADCESKQPVYTHFYRYDSKARRPVLVQCPTLPPIAPIARPKAKVKLPSISAIHPPIVKPQAVRPARALPLPRTSSPDPNAFARMVAGMILHRQPAGGSPRRKLRSMGYVKSGLSSVVSIIA